MNATVDTAQAPQDVHAPRAALALAQASPPRPEAEVLELFPGAQGSRPVRLPTHPHSTAEAGRARPSDGSAVPRRSKVRLMGSELGMATAEYAIATLAAVGFAGLLVVILRSEEVRGFLLNLIRSALSLP
ncbi:MULTISPECIES: DUF4244 domain-containing protein [Arthrobacter]|jgi:hypothetical protein|uniref:DUF4244 domain-containing protein n=1 Tax=Arthrobacter bambusae TaxID=1338426 RepID=A0AAW8DBX6_9MICC|nr:DUF4244 domain-containing protein [Arthrobacter bambusae]MDP9903780.1 hypothetical protein [Arthrobacter bambusae]MDQ0128225.1 hypothetical protein [Arthrobacter bambusae]MDQ0179567.1 hypothetical protein [Arthrobacter bambusae]